MMAMAAMFPYIERPRRRYQRAQATTSTNGQAVFTFTGTAAGSPGIPVPVELLVDLREELDRCRPISGSRRGPNRR
jgi:hypothetical protein